MAVLYPAMEYSEVEVEIERKGEYPNMKKQVKENGKKKIILEKMKKKQSEEGKIQIPYHVPTLFYTVSKGSRDGQREV